MGKITEKNTLPQPYDRTIKSNLTGSNMIVMFLGIDKLPSIEENSYIVSVSDEGVVYGSCFIRENQKDNVPIAVWGTNPDTSHKDGFLDSEKVNFQYITNGQVYDIDANIREKNRNNGTYIKDDVLVVLDFTTKLR